MEDAATGKTVAKISRDMVKTAKMGDDKPKQVTRTQVDIPSQGIHEITIDKKANSLLNRLNRENNGDSGENMEVRAGPLQTPYDVHRRNPTQKHIQTMNVQLADIPTYHSTKIPCSENVHNYCGYEHSSNSTWAKMQAV